MRKRGFSLLLAAALLLCACQETPETAAVVSKTDLTKESLAENTGETEAVELPTGTFSSTDGSVTYVWQVESAPTMKAGSVTEVSPHYLTLADEQRIVEILCPNAAYFALDTPQTKSELQETITLLSGYLSEEALRGLMGDIYEQYGISYVQQQISGYTVQMESAPETTEESSEAWPEGSEDLYVKSGNVTYAVSATADSVTGANYITVSVSGRNDDFVENLARKDALYSEEAPTQAQLDAAWEQALELLNQMGFGEFTVTETTAKQNSYTGKYSIQVKAYPVINGEAVLSGQSERSAEGVADMSEDNSSYSVSYSLTSAELTLSNDGTLMEFRLYAPVDTVRVVQENAATLTMSALCERVQQQLSLYDLSGIDSLTGNEAFMFAVKNNGYTASELASDMDCRVTITGVEYGLARCKVSDSTNYYYTPAILVSGSADFYDKGTDNLLVSAEAFTLVTVNAVDGSIISGNG